MLTSCQQDAPLPILGQPDIDEKGNELPHVVDDFSFIDHSGNERVSTKEDGQIMVMNYFFTSCPTICPLMTDNLAEVFKEYVDNENIIFYSASVDPKRDQPDRLRQFMTSHKIPHDKNWYFLTGNKKELYHFARYELFLSAMEVVENIDDDFIHSEKVVLIDPNRNIRGFYTGTDKKEMQRLRSDIKKLKR